MTEGFREWIEQAVCNCIALVTHGLARWPSTRIISTGMCIFSKIETRVCLMGPDQDPGDAKRVTGLEINFPTQYAGHVLVSAPQ
eukprot:3545672-Prymnesium_polylepis.1